jgi:hypothetical protein
VLNRSAPSFLASKDDARVVLPINVAYGNVDPILYPPSRETVTNKGVFAVPASHAGPSIIKQVDPERNQRLATRHRLDYEPKSRDDTLRQKAAARMAQEDVKAKCSADRVPINGPQAVNIPDMPEFTTTYERQMVPHSMHFADMNRASAANIRKAQTGPTPPVCSVVPS